MELYPIPPYPNEEDFEVTPRWMTVVSNFDALNEQRKQKALFAVYNVAFSYEHLTVSEEQTLWAFYMARKGSYEAFYIYDIYSWPHTGLFVGWGDASTFTFDLQGKTTSAQAIYLDGVLQSSGYTIVSGGGAEGSDRVTFDAAPAAGVLITCDFTGYLRARVRYKEDKLSRRSFRK
jgi:hypothetical protein